MGFQKATKKKSKLRCAIYGLSGGGKTYTALQISTGISEVLNTRIAFIDTENGTASKYSDIFDFDVLELKKHSIDDYANAIKEASQSGYQILIIDSISHAWQELLIEVENLSKAKYKGNSWSAWSEGTPKQKKLTNAILNFDGHIITTMRAKTEWVSNVNDKGRTTPTKVGLAPEQGKGIEYEFDFLMSISQDHILQVEKDRSGKFQDKLIDKPGKDFGKDLINWLLDGVDVPKEKTLLDKVKDGIAECKANKKLDKDNKPIPLITYLVDLQNKIAKFKEDPLYESSNDVIKKELVELTTDDEGEE